MKIETRGLPNNTWWGSHGVYHAWGYNYCTQCGINWDTLYPLDPLALWAVADANLCQDCYVLELMRELSK